MTEPTTIRVAAKGVELVLRTDPGLFSPRSLDPGTAAMLEVVPVGPTDEVLDLGCGYGPVGLVIAKLIGPERVWMSDIDPVAVNLSRENAERNQLAGVTTVVSDGVDGISRAAFTLILCNPPYHVDFAVPKKLIRKGFNRLAIGGRMALVVKREEWYRQQLSAVFGGCRVTVLNGYSVLIAEKRSGTWARA